MILSTYDKFSKAIEYDKVDEAENIFAYSDIRCELLSYSMKYYDKDLIISVISSFSSKGLREQALKICDKCSVENCQLKQELQSTKDIHYITSEENIYLNKKRYFDKNQNEKIFDIHLGEYIEN